MYKILKPILFLLPPEAAHWVGLTVVKFIGFLYKNGFWPKPKVLRQEESDRLEIATPFGTVQTPLGLAAGFDKNGEALFGWQALGFSFVEVGTVTPQPQSGNPKPRLFRLASLRGLINR